MYARLFLLTSVQHLRLVVANAYYFERIQINLNELPGFSASRSQRLNDDIFHPMDMVSQLINLTVSKVTRKAIVVTANASIRLFSLRHHVRSSLFARR